MNEIIEILVVLVIGALVGVEFGVTAFSHPILERLPDAAYSQGRSASARILGRVMPFWYGLAVLLLLSAVAVRPQPLFIAAALVMGAVMLLTFTVLVPANNRVAAWAGPADVSHELAGRWDRLHWLRVALLAVVFVLLVVGSGR
ncbi:DUF1772 domain-containing protein [Mycobacterium sp. LTG2003]